MNIKTKFELNDKAWLIRQEPLKIWKPCAGCNATGKIKLADSSETACPKCYGRKGETVWGKQAWQVARCLTVGQVNVRIESIVPDGIFDNEGHYDESAITREESYMCYETGVGSGSNWKADNLFAIESEAVDACNERNSAVQP